MMVFNWLTKWYLNEREWEWCGKDGITISDIGNPGWSIDISLEYTSLEDEEFLPVIIERSEHDWVHCKVENNVFKGCGGPYNLEEMLLIFKQWAEKDGSK